MIGYLRNYKPESCIVEPKIAMENKPDFRFTSPWPELLEHCMAIDLAGFEGAEARNDHNHTPFGIILVQAVQKWREAHEGKLPKNFAEKNLFK